MWSIVELTAGKTPLLYDGESKITAVGQVGLYFGAEKSLKHQSGWIYLTTRRLCYVDDAHPDEYSCSIELNQIINSEFMPKFLRKSPKIIISLKEQENKAPITRSWVCSICSFSNPLSVKYVEGQSKLPSCENCGVQCTESPNFVEYKAQDIQIDPEEGTVCSRCTFVNHPYLHECEMCGLVLKHRQKKFSFGSEVKLSFRGGGAKSFYEELSKTIHQPLSSTAPSPSPESTRESTPNGLSTGIGQLRLQAQESTSLEVAFKDVHDIVASAENIVRMLEAHKRISTDYTPIYNLEGTLVFRDSSKYEKSYLIQLARQISEFLESNGILHQQGGLMSVFDVFAVYNRARGIEPVSASDLNRALELAPSLGLPVTMRSLRSGTKIIAGNLWASPQSRIEDWVRKSHPNDGFTALDASAKFGWSLYVSIEELESAEEMGSLARDETAAGVRFYLNKFPV